MIYFRFNVVTQIKFNIPEYAKITEEETESEFYRFRFLADTMFRYINGETYYLKDRFGTGYQYSGEEMVVISLSAVLVY